ncbi:MAG: alpha/beta fold hydrolase, partial [Gammaproteobacteria bacterium]
MPRIRKGYAEGRWGQIHYMECGHEGGHGYGHEHEKGLPLLLLHQSPTDSVQFARVMRPLAVRGIHAIAIDLPGFGGSDTPPAPPTVADYAHIVPAVLDQLGIDSASVLGHHTGAI